MIEYQAPGKAVIWGEYAVLAGAPALVMALNRYASCRIQPGGGSWICRARGFSDEIAVSQTQLLEGSVAMDRAAAPLAAAIKALAIDDLPQGAQVDLDTRTFYAASDPTRKLGIGSSAAICTAVCGALAQMSGRTLDFHTALTAHRLLQQAQGSGIDVAASFSGGVIRFEAGIPSSAHWPKDLYYQFVWTGVSAKTTSHLRTFAQWRGSADTSPLDNLVARCHTLFEHCDLENLARYVGALKNMDQAATLGIYTEPHLTLDRLAIERQLVYKPCGAGGGDIGIAFAEDPRDLVTFAEAAARLAFHPLSLEIAAYGLKPTR